MSRLACFCARLILLLVFGDGLALKTVGILSVTHTGFEIQGVTGLRVRVLTATGGLEIECITRPHIPMLAPTGLFGLAAIVIIHISLLVEIELMKGYVGVVRGMQSTKFGLPVLL